MTKTATAAEPGDFYDTLSPTARDTWDAIGSYGWRPEKTDDGYSATENSDDLRFVGPFENLGGLLAAVQGIVGEGARARGSEGETETGSISEPVEKSKPRKAKKPPTGLSLADVAIWSEIKGLGFSAVEDETTETWMAYEIDGEREIGPSTMIAALLTMVVAELTDDTEIVLDVDPATDAPFLTGMAPTRNKQLADAIVRQHEKKMIRVEATAGETKANQEMDIIGKIHKDLYKDDPEMPGTKIYAVGSITSRLVITQDEKFVTEANA